MTAHFVPVVPVYSVHRGNIELTPIQVNMGSMFLTLIKTLLSTLTTHRSLALENLALRQQNTKSRTFTQGLRESLLYRWTGFFGRTGGYTSVIDIVSAAAPSQSVGSSSLGATLSQPWCLGSTVRQESGSHGEAICPLPISIRIGRVQKTTLNY